MNDVSAAPPPTLVAAPPARVTSPKPATHNLGCIDSACAEDVVHAADAYHAVTSLHFHAAERPAPALLSTSRWQQEVKDKAPFGNVTEVRGPDTKSFVSQFCVSQLERPFVTQAHLEWAGRPQPRVDDDLRWLLTTYRHAQFVSLCSDIINRDVLLQDAKVCAARGERDGAKSASLAPEKQQELVFQSQVVDIARTIYCAQQVARAFAPPTMERLQLLFDAQGCRSFEIALRCALRLQVDGTNKTGPILATHLLSPRPASDATTFQWQIAWQEKPSGPIRARLLVAFPNAPFRLLPIIADEITPNALREGMVSSRPVAPPHVLTTS